MTVAMTMPAVVSQKAAVHGPGSGRPTGKTDASAGPSRYSAGPKSTVPAKKNHLPRSEPVSASETPRR
jgi:hypothetical protein